MVFLWLKLNSWLEIYNSIQQVFLSDRQNDIDGLKNYS